MMQRRHANDPPGGGDAAGVPPAPSTFYARRGPSRNRAQTCLLVVSLFVSTLALVAWFHHITNESQDHALLRMQNEPNAQTNMSAGAYDHQPAMNLGRVESAADVNPQQRAVRKNAAGDRAHNEDVKPEAGNKRRGEQSSAKILSFPPGCRWDCYLDRYPDLTEKIGRMEEAALGHYLKRGLREGRDCSCIDEKKKEKQPKQEPTTNALKNAGPNELPAFSSLPSPDSLCHIDHHHNMKVSKYCMNLTCWTHERDVDEKMIEPALGKSAVPDDKGGGTSGCKMLWFTAIHESEILCDNDVDSYSVFYSAALGSARLNAGDSLQPVLVLGRLGMENENSTEHKKLGRWAEERGVKVIYSPRLSFQEDVNRARQEWVKVKYYTGLQSTFLRLDIPHFVTMHGLLDLPHVCKRHVLYTDVDVIFANRITQQDTQTLAKLTGDAMVMYGREILKKARMINAGVIVMNVDTFGREMKQFHAFSRNHPDKPHRNVQSLLNLYQKSPNSTDKYKLLPMHYNWVPYWSLEPSSFSQVKIIHSHGPKPGRLLEDMAICNRTAMDVDMRVKRYGGLFDQGMCCDQGRTAKWTLDAFNQLRAPIHELC